MSFTINGRCLLKDVGGCPLPEKPGVYFWIIPAKKSNRLIYVGSTNNLSNRLGVELKNLTKGFDPIHSDYIDPFLKKHIKDHYLMKHHYDFVFKKNGSNTDIRNSHLRSVNKMTEEVEIIWTEFEDYKDFEKWVYERFLEDLSFKLSPPDLNFRRPPGDSSKINFDWVTVKKVLGIS